MAKSSALAHEPVDEYVAWRAAGQTLAGSDEQLVAEGETTYESTFWPRTGSLVAHPSDGRQAWAVYPVSTWENFPGAALTTRLRGGLTADPGGTLVVGNGSGWINTPDVGLTLLPDVNSPIRRVRWSASPEVEATPGGDRLIHAREALTTQSVRIDLNSDEFGGGPLGASATAYVQWQAADGTWSTPTSSTVHVDQTIPEVAPLTYGFTTGTAGYTAPVNVAWTITETESGVGAIELNQTRQYPTPNESLTLRYAASATSTTRRLVLGGQYGFHQVVFDRAGNRGESAQESMRTRVAGGTAIGTWRTESSSSFLSRSTRYSSSRGARMTYTFTGRAIAFVSTKASNRGKAEIYLDGQLRATIDLRSSTTRYRQIVWTARVTPGTHTVQVRVLGTAGRPRVDVDAFLSL
jgi:hypothetical protein